MADATFAIVCDSACDLTVAQLGRLGVVLVPHTLTVGEKSWRDVSERDSDEVYELLAEKGARAIVRTPVSVDDLLAAYRELGRQGFDHVVSVHSAAVGSSVPDIAREAAELVADEIMVEVLETGSASLGTGIVIERLAAFRAAGMPCSQALSVAHDVARSIRLFFSPAPNSNFVRHGARSRHSALVARASALRVRLVGERGLFLVSCGEMTQCVRTSDVDVVCRRIAAAITAVRKAEGDVSYVELYSGSRQLLRPLDAALAEAGLESGRLGSWRVSPGVASCVGLGAIGVAFLPNALLTRGGVGEPVTPEQVD